MSDRQELIYLLIGSIVKKFRMSFVFAENIKILFSGLTLLL